MKFYIKFCITWKRKYEDISLILRESESTSVESTDFGRIWSIVQKFCLLTKSKHHQTDVSEMERAYPSSILIASNDQSSCPCNHIALDHQIEHLASIVRASARCMHRNRRVTNWAKRNKVSPEQELSDSTASRRTQLRPIYVPPSL